MGNSRLNRKGISVIPYLFRNVQEIKMIDGIKGKVVQDVTDRIGINRKMPKKDPECDLIFILGPDGFPIRAVKYLMPNLILEFDWNHAHVNHDGTIIPKGVVHVMRYSINISGQAIPMDTSARLMTVSEIKKYGKIIHHYVPHVKFV